MITMPVSKHSRGFRNLIYISNVSFASAITRGHELQETKEDTCKKQK